MTLRSILTINFKKTQSGVDNAVSKLTNSIIDVARQTLPENTEKIKEQGQLKRSGMTNLVLI